MADLRGKLSFARSILFTAPLIFLYTGVLATISLIGSIFDSQGTFQHACSRLWSRLILWTSRVRLEVSGAENLKRDMAYVLCVNHQSDMDIPIVLAALPIRFRFAAKKELFRYPFLGWHLRRSGHVPIDRGNPRAAIRSISKAAKTIQGGTPLVIFPEGKTSLDGTILQFKGGGFMLATRSGTEVVPVAILGARKVLQPDTYHVRGGIVKVKIGHPIPSEGINNADLAQIVRNEIIELFEGTRHEQTMDRHSGALP